MAPDRDCHRHWLNGGHAWISPAFTYPSAWVLSIPYSRDRAHDEHTASLPDALTRAAEVGLRLDVDEWTYDLMVGEGHAPAERPAAALRPTGEYPGTGVDPGVDTRLLSLAVLSHAADFMGLSRDAAEALAQESGIWVDVLDENDLAVLDHSPTRLNLHLEHGMVARASIG